MKLADLIIMGMVAAWLLSLWAIASPGNDHIQVLASSSTAAWVQAFGTIAAIFGAAWIARDQIKLQARLHRAKRITSSYIVAREAGLHVVRFYRLATRSAKSAAQVQADDETIRRFPAGWNAWMPERMEDLAKWLGEIDASAIASGAFLVDALTIKARLSWARNEIGQHIGTDNLPAEKLELLTTAAIEVLGCLKRMREIVDRMRAGVIDDDFPKTSQPEPEIRYDGLEYHRNLFTIIPKL